MTLKKAALDNFISKAVTFIVQMVINMILSRLIAPNAFGIFAILTIVINFLNLFVDMGMGVAIIQGKEIPQKQLDNLFTLTLYLGLIMMGILVLISYPIAVWFKEPAYTKLFSIASVMALFNALNVVPSALIQKECRFNLIMYRTIVLSILTGVIAIAVAFMGGGYYALLAYNISFSVLTFLWNFLTEQVRLVGKVSFSEAKTLMGTYSLFQVLFNIINYFTRNIDTLLIGKVMGDVSLGYYNKAYSINLYPNILFTSTITQAIHPFFCKFENDIDRMYEELLKIVKFVSIVSVYISISVHYCSREIILIMFGPNWEGAVSSFFYLSLCLWPQLVSSICGSIFLSLRRTDQVFKCGIINLLLIIGAVAVGISMNNLDVMSFAVSMAYTLIFITTYFILIKRTMRKSVKTFLEVVLPDVIVWLIFIIAADYYKQLVQVDSLLQALLIKMLIATFYYLVYLFTSKRYRYIISFVKRK